MKISYFVFVFENLILFLFKSFIAKEGSDIVSILLILNYSFFFIIELKSNEKTRLFFAPLIIMYFTRVFLLFFDYFGRDIYLLPMSGGDELGFYASAIKYANNKSITYGGLFAKTMGIIARFVGENKLWLQFILVLISVVSVMLLIKIFEIIDISLDVQSKVIWIVCLLPYSSLILCHFGRESIVVFLMLLSVYFFILWSINGQTIKIILSFLLISISAVYHSGTIGVLISYFIIIFFYNIKSGQFEFGKIKIIVVIISLLVFVFVSNYKDLFLSKMNGLNSVTDIARTLDKGGSSYAKYVGNSNSIKNIIIYTIPRLLYFVFSPFPWQWRGINDILAFCASSVFYFCVFINTIKYFNSNIKKNRFLIILFSFIIIITYLIFSWGTSNTGTALRHRDKLLLFQAVLLACELDSYKHED